MMRTVLVLAALAVAARADEAPPKGLRVFVSGHSFHVPIANPLTEIAKSAKVADHKLVGTQFIGGSRTIQHWNLPEEKNRAKSAIVAGEVDVLTVSPHAQIPDEGVTLYAKWLRKHNPNGRLYIQASWFPYDRPGRNGANFKNSDRDSADLPAVRRDYEPYYKKIIEQIEGLNPELKTDAGGPAIYLVPVGHAVVALREKVVEGKVPGVAKQSDLFFDPIGHGKPSIIALAAYCHYAAIYRCNPVGLPVPPGLKGADAEKLNRLLQEIAWDAVRAEPLSGVAK